MIAIDMELFELAMGPLPEEFVWQPWGFLLDDEPTAEAEGVDEASLLDLRPDDTQFLSVREFVLATEFPFVPAQREGGADL